MKLRVYYEDTDAAGIVYYANYLKFAERGRTEMMRALGFAHSSIRAETGIIFTVRRLSADYRGPARLDDALSVDTRILEIGGATLLLDQPLTAAKSRMRRKRRIATRCVPRARRAISAAPSGCRSKARMRAPRATICASSAGS